MSHIDTFSGGPSYRHKLHLTSPTDGESKSDIRCAQQNRGIPAIGEDKVLSRENETMLKKKRKGELEAFKAFGLPLTELKAKYTDYLRIKARSHDVKLT